MNKSEVDDATLGRYLRREIAALERDEANLSEYGREQLKILQQIVRFANEES